MTGKLTYLGPRPEAAAAFKLLGNLFLMFLTTGLADMLALAKATRRRAGGRSEALRYLQPRGDDRRADEAHARREVLRGLVGAVDGAQGRAHHARGGGAPKQVPLAVLPAIAARMDAVIAEGHGTDDWTVHREGRALPVKRIGTTDLQVFPLALGGNTFGWTSDEAESFDVLDAYAAAGGNLVDTADVYSSWAPGNVGGESETILGRWMKERKNRSASSSATKVGQLEGVKGLSAKIIRTAAEASLRRLQTDVIDLYYAHIDDQATPLEETLGAFDALVREGKVRHIAASQYTAPRLAEALAVSAKNGFARYVALQTQLQPRAPQGLRGRARRPLRAREGLVRCRSSRSRGAF